MEKHIFEETDNFLSLEERSRLVRLCATLVDDSQVAEDLAQETLLEAWRHQQALRDPARYSQWLTGIARNVCLRWLREHGRELSHLATLTTQADTQDTKLEDTLADDFDIEVELERKELIELLDRSLALLPPETRTVLIQHYIEESPLAELAAQLGTNPHAVAMRLQRGKLTLRRLLTNSTEYNLLPATLSLPTTRWEETPLWCDMCGQHRLLGIRNQQEGNLFLKCPHCSPEANQATSINHHLATLKEVKGYWRTTCCYSDYSYWYQQPALARCALFRHLSAVGIAVPSGISTIVQKQEEGQGYLRDLWGGLVTVRHNALIATVIITAMITNLIDAAWFSVVGPAYSKSIFHSPLPFGLMSAALGGSAFVGTLIFGAIGHRLPRRLTFGLGFTLGGGMRFWIALFPILPLLIGWNLIAGLGIAPINPLTRWYRSVFPKRCGLAYSAP